MNDAPDITTILEYYGAVVPTRSGWAKLKCPFHDDSHASAEVNLRDNIFKCHGCQYKGDAYAIIMLKEGVGFREAITLAKGIFDQSGKVLPQRPARSGGIPRRTGYNNGTRPENALGRRARAAHGS